MNVFCVLMVSAVVPLLLTEASPTGLSSGRARRQTAVVPYEPDESRHSPFVIVADDLDVAEDVGDIGNEIDAAQQPQPFVIEVPDGESAALDDYDGDLDGEQTRYAVEGPFLIRVDEADGDRRGRTERNADELRSQLSRDAAELSRDLTRQREALRRQQAADRAREREELRRQELEVKLQLEQQRRQDEVQALQDARYQTGAGPQSARLAAYEDYAYDDALYN